MFSKLFKKVKSIFGQDDQTDGYFDGLGSSYFSYDKKLNSCPCTKKCSQNIFEYDPDSIDCYNEDECSSPDEETDDTEE